MAYTPFKMKGNPMKRNFGIGAAPAKMKKESPMKKDDKTLVAKSDSMDVAHDKFMKKRMEELMKQAQKSSDSLGTVRNKVINKSVDKKTEAIEKEDSMKKRKKMTTDLGKEIGDLNKKRSGMKMMKKSPAKKPLVGKQKNLPEELKKKILASPTKMKKESAMKMKKEPGRGGAKLMSKTKLAKIQKRQKEEKMIKGVEKTRAKELARKRKPKPGGALKMKKKK